MESIATSAPMIIEQAVPSPVRYCLYARKSTEQDELQALSIDSQIKEMVDMATREGIQIAEIRRESHSAKESGQRPVFQQMLVDIRKGMFNGIIAWDPSRISRNAGDLGSVVDLMDQKLIVDIRTHGQRFTNSPNEKFLLMILCSQAKLENDHKGENVKRGLRAKCEMGYRPGMSPIGYMHDTTVRKGQKRIIIDPERAPFVKQMFEMMAEREVSGRDLYQWFVDRGVTSRGGYTIALSAIQRMMRDTFYYGEFEYPTGSGIWYKGSYEPLISKELFLAAQANLKVGYKRRHVGVREFDFTRLFSCGGCGSGITAQNKFKHCANGNVHHYIYYCCTRYHDKYCKEKPLREEDLVAQLVEVLDQIEIDELGAREKIDREVARYRQLAYGILGQETELDRKSYEADVRKYAKYVLVNGSREEKREILGCIKTRVCLKSKQISLKN